MQQHVYAAMVRVRDAVPARPQFEDALDSVDRRRERVLEPFAFALEKVDVPLDRCRLGGADAT
jgi:hypothetical protein